MISVIFSSQLGNCYWTLSYLIIMLDTFQSLEISLEASFQVHRAPFFSHVIVVKAVT